MAFFTEAHVEESLIEQLRGLGYANATDADIGPDAVKAERESYGDVILLPRLTAAIARLNPAFPGEARADGIRKVCKRKPRPSLPRTDGSTSC
jgi:type I restriction enzyme, R subunit